MRFFQKLVIFIFISLVIISCQSQLEKQEKSKDIEKSLEIADSIIIKQYDGQRIAWQLYADRMRKLTDKDILHFYSMKLVIFGKEKDSTSTIFADSAKIDDNRNLITGKGNVEIYTPKGNLFGSTLKWDRNSGRIYSNDSVKVIKQENVLYGKSFRSDEQFKHMVLEKATATGEVSAKEQVW